MLKNCKSVTLKRPGFQHHRFKVLKAFLATAHCSTRKATMSMASVLEDITTDICRPLSTFEMCSVIYTIHLLTNVEDAFK